MEMTALRRRQMPNSVMSPSRSAGAGPGVQTASLSKVMGTDRIRVHNDSISLGERPVKILGMVSVLVVTGAAIASAKHGKPLAPTSWDARESAIPTINANAALETAGLPWVGISPTTSGVNPLRSTVTLAAAPQRSGDREAHGPSRAGHQASTQPHPTTRHENQPEQHPSHRDHAKGHGNHDTDWKTRLSIIPGFRRGTSLGELGEFEYGVAFPVGLTDESEDWGVLVKLDWSIPAR